MAELILKTRDGANYRDGDLLAAVVDQCGDSIANELLRAAFN